MKQYPESQTVPGILIARVDAPFYFASVHVSAGRFHVQALKVPMHAHNAQLSRCRTLVTMRFIRSHLQS